MEKLTEIKYARKIINEKINQIKLKKEKEKKTIYDALGLILSEDIFAKKSLPLFSKSTVDGYAVNSIDTIGASNSFGIPLIVKGKILIGKMKNVKLATRECYEVFTGSMIPTNCDSVIMKEYTEKINNKEVIIYKTSNPNDNIINKNEDVLKNNLIFKKNHILKNQDISILKSVGIKKVFVFKKIRICIFSTGNELINNHDNINSCKTIDINGPLLNNILNDMKNIQSYYLGILKDNIKKIKQNILNNIKKFDIFIFSGGSSVGDKDFMLKTIQVLGKVLFYGLPIKPGKPTMLGMVENKLIIGLPGHPMSCYFVCNDFFMFPLSNNCLKKKSFLLGKLQKNIFSISGRLDYIPIKFLEDTNKIIPILGKSGLLYPLCKADGYIKIPFSKEGLKKNTEIKVFLF